MSLTAPSVRLLLATALPLTTALPLMALPLTMLLPWPHYLLCSYCPTTMAALASAALWLPSLRRPPPMAPRATAARAGAPPPRDRQRDALELRCPLPLPRCRRGSPHPVTPYPEVCTVVCTVVYAVVCTVVCTVVGTRAHRLRRRLPCRPPPGGALRQAQARHPRRPPPRLGGGGRVLRLHSECQGATLHRAPATPPPPRMLLPLPLPLHPHLHRGASPSPPPAAAAMRPPSPLTVRAPPSPGAGVASGSRAGRLPDVRPIRAPAAARLRQLGAAARRRGTLPVHRCCTALHLLERRVRPRPLCLRGERCLARVASFTHRCAAKGN